MRASDSFVGRDLERQHFAELVDAARRGESRVLVVKGEAGIGKTALLRHGLVESADVRVIHIVGAESELELTYAAVQQVCAPLTDTIGRLPRAQRGALRVALGYDTGDVPDRLLVGLALLTLLSEASAERAAVCVIDDAQWVDVASLQALAIVARRIAADRVAMVFAVRDSYDVHELHGLPGMTLTGLNRVDAGALLAAGLPGRIDEQVLENILDEAQGNPLALQELTQAITSDGLAGGYGLGQVTSGRNAIEETYRRRLQELPSDTQMLLLVAACDPAGRSDWLWSASDLLGIDRSAASPAAGEGLVTVGPGIRFSHPLIRAVVYHEASDADRRTAHGALAQSIVDAHAGEYRAWHRAHATITANEDVAQNLESSAERASARGGWAAAGAFLAKAAELTPDNDGRARRLVDAAQAKLDAGATEQTAQLIALARSLSADPMIHARSSTIRARLAYATSRGREVPALLLTAAQQMESLDPLVAREIYLNALSAATLIGRFAATEQDSAAGIARVARLAPRPPSTPRAVDLLLEAAIIRVEQGAIAAAPIFKQALSRYMQDLSAGQVTHGALDFVWRPALDLADHDTYDAYTTHLVATLRAAGALSQLPIALYTRAGSNLWAGRLEEAARLIDEAAVIGAVTRQPLPKGIRAQLGGCLGDEQYCHASLAETISAGRERGEGFDITVAQHGTAILENGLGHYEEAFAAASAGLQYDDFGLRALLLTELAESASRSGASEAVQDACSELVELARISGTSTAHGMACRAKGLVDDTDAEGAFLEAIDHFERSPVRFFLHRTHLVYGEWLRRAKRRGDARKHLQIACDELTLAGAKGFAQRARNELRATGMVVANHESNTAAVLTTQEHQIAKLARDGHTNTEIAAVLFLSPRTVEWHLGRIFTKLGVRTRRDLRRIALEIT
ncbi:MAG: AAA family ATPase [Mycobacterium sp.]